MKTSKVIPFEYEELYDEDKLYEYCKLADFKFKTINTSSMKNYVTNFLFMVEELSSAEKYIFYFLYDLKSQQRYMHWLVINNKKIAMLLWLSESIVSRTIRKLVLYSMIYLWINKYNEKVIIINEVIDKWWVAINETRLSYIEEFRKHLASSNVQLTEEYKSYNE